MKANHLMLSKSASCCYWEWKRHHLVQWRWRQPFADGSRKESDDRGVIGGLRNFV